MTAGVCTRCSGYIFDGRCMRCHFTPEEVQAQDQVLRRVAAETNERIRTCHERLACPTCAAEIGQRCRAMPKGWSSREGGGRVMQYSHEQRWTQEVPKR